MTKEYSKKLENNRKYLKFEEKSQKWNEKGHKVTNCTKSIEKKKQG